MTREELLELIPDLVDGTLSAEQRTAAEAALQQYPECRQELQAARRVRHLLLAFQEAYTDIRIPQGFTARLLGRIHQQHSSLEFMHLSSRMLGLWLRELINMLGELSIRPMPTITPEAEARILRRMLQQEWLDLSLRTFGFWLRDLIDLVGGLSTQIQE